MNFVNLSPSHQGVITDIQFDYYGKRFASASADGIIVWTLNEEKNEWESCPIPQGAQYNICRLSWAHPEFGQLLVTCCMDRTINIWEEQDIVVKTNSPEYSKDRWLKKASVSDCKKNVYDVKFAPRFMGLKFAAACEDGYVRMYEAADIFTLNFWQLQESFSVADISSEQSVSSVDGALQSLSCLCWCDCLPPRLAICHGTRSVIFVNKDNKWVEECVLADGVASRDVAVAPTMGRSLFYVAVAVASKTPTNNSGLYMYTLRKNQDNLELVSSVLLLPGQSSSPVNRVTWNATGTVLSAALEDGSLSLWRKNFSGEWKEIDTMKADATQFSSFLRDI